MANPLYELLRKTLVQNALALYGVQFVNYLLPLITIPFLTRVLGVAGWGRFAFFQSFGLFAATVIEYSFYLAATRDISQHREDPQKRSELLAGVMGAKLLLALGIIALCFVLQLFIPPFREHRFLYWMGLAWAITLALNFIWYFQGLEKMRVAAALDLTAKFIATVAVFMVIRTPQDAWKIFLLYAFANLTSVSLATVLAYRQIPFCWPTRRLIWDVLRRGWQLFIARLWSNLFTVGNSFIMGLLAAPIQVGYFAGSEKITRAAASLANPVNQALFPRLSLLQRQDPEKAQQLIRHSFRFLLILSVTLTVGLFLAAPLLTKTILGPTYLPATSALRWMSFLPFVLAMTSIFGLQWMLALQLDKQFNRIVFLAGIVNLTLAVLLVPRWGALGMAVAVLAAETVVATGSYLILWRSGLHPFHRSSRSRPFLVEREEE